MGPSSILIVKTSALGDVVQTLPVLSDLRRRFPKAKIDWVVEKGSAPLLAAHPHLDEVIQIDTKSWRKKPFDPRTWKEIAALRRKLKSSSYDLLFDLQGNTKSALVTGMADATVKVGFGRGCVPEWPNLLATHTHYEVSKGINARLRYLELIQSHFNAHMKEKQDQPDRLRRQDQQDELNNDYPAYPAAKRSCYPVNSFDSLAVQETHFCLTAEEKMRLEMFRKELPKAPKLMILFGSKWPNKRLSEAMWERFLTLIDHSVHPFFVFVWGDEEEKSLADKLHSTFPGRSLPIGDVSLPLWQALMQEVDGVVAVDSLGLHLCGTTKTPSFSIFGPSSAQVYIPIGGQHEAFQGACPYGESFEKRCPKLRTCPTGACLKEISEEKLFADFMSWWQRAAGQS